MWYRIDSKIPTKGAHLTGFPDLVFQDGYAYTTDTSAVAAARAAADFSVTRINDIQLEPGFHLDKTTGNPVAALANKIVPLGFGGGDFAAEVEDAGGIEAGQVVVWGSQPWKVSGVLPDTSGSSGSPPPKYGVWNVAGVAINGGAQGDQITVRASGVALVRLGETVAAKDWLVGHGSNGRAYAANRPSTTTGASNTGLRWRLRRPSHGGHTNAIQVAVSGTNTPLSVTVSANLIRVDVETNGSGDPVSTAAQIMNLVNNHPAASQLVVLTLLGDGTGTPGSATATIGLNFESLNVFAIALEGGDAGDLIPVLLRQR
jgi:hypothetical protein